MAKKTVFFVTLLVILLGVFCASVETNISPLWSKDVSSSVDSIKILDKNIFVLTGDDNIHLLTTTGRVRWSKPFETSVTSIALSDRFLGVSLANGELILLDYGGERVWSRNIESYVGFSDALEITENGFYAGDMKGSVYFFDLNGTLKWEKNTDAYVISLKETPDTLLVVSDKGVYTLEKEELRKKLALEGYARTSDLHEDFSAVTSSEGDILLLDSKGGLLLNKNLSETPGAVCSSPYGVSAGTKKGRVYSLDLSGVNRWSTQLEGSITRVFLNREYVIASSTENTVYGFNWRGRSIWVNQEGFPVTALTARDDALVYGTQRGLIKYFVLTENTEGNFYILFFLMGITLAISFWLVFRNWNIKKR
jgi:hypothetical protein